MGSLTGTRRSGTVEQAVQGFDVDLCPGMEGTALGDCSRQVPQSGNDTPQAGTSRLAAPVPDGVTHDTAL